MGYPRAHLVDADNGGNYHVFTRCVQQQWLCGTDPATGRCYEHRKQWIEDRLLELATIFAIDLYSYAVMSNHYHAVVGVIVERARLWSDEEVVRRWLRLCVKKSSKSVELQVAIILADARRVAELRRRLGNLSWFMRYLNEHIARRANGESGTQGRFWEGRFKSKELLDDSATLACMGYVDLNPVRAGIVDRPADAPHTSIRRRVFESEERTSPLVPLASLGLTVTQYRALLDWTAIVHGGSTEGPSRETRQVLRRVGHDDREWLGRVHAHTFKYRAYGALNSLRAHAEKLGQRWIKGAKPGMAAPP